MVLLFNPPVLTLVPLRVCSAPGAAPSQRTDTGGGALPGDQERVPITPLSLPNVAGGAHAWCLDTFRIGEEGTGLDALCGYTAEDSHTGSQNPTT